MTAAQDAGYATRAVHLFYSLLQAGQAIVAASPALAALPQGGGHGISVVRGASTLAGIEVKSTGGGDFNAVAEALGEPPLTRGEAITMATLWPTIGETRAVPLLAAPPHPLLVFEPDGPSNGQAAGGWLLRVPDDVYQSVGQDQAKLLTYVGSYPSLHGLECSATQGLAWRPNTEPGLGWDVHVRMHFQVKGVDVPQIVTAAGSESGTMDTYLAGPAIGTMTEQLHPILTWWAVLIALSSMTRYEPVGWARMIDIDSSSDANAIEHLLDEAITVVPHMVLHQLERFI